jgi:arsenate reductase
VRANPKKLQQILVICSGNSCRSQIAEAWFENLAPYQISASSAGTVPSGYIHPLAIRVMDEVGIDLSSKTSKSVEQYLDHPFDTVITVCDEAEAACPVFPGRVERLHWPFEDPAKANGTEAEQLEVFKKVRDQIRARVEEYLEQ